MAPLPAREGPWGATGACGHCRAGSHCPSGAAAELSREVCGFQRVRGPCMWYLRCFPVPPTFSFEGNLDGFLMIFLGSCLFSGVLWETSRV